MPGVCGAHFRRRILQGIENRLKSPPPRFFQKSAAGVLNFRIFGFVEKTVRSPTARRLGKPTARRQAAVKFADFSVYTSVPRL